MFNIDRQPQLLVYYGPTINVSDLPGYLEIQTIYSYKKKPGDSNSIVTDFYVESFDAANVASGDDWLNDISTLENGKQYIILSKNPNSLSYVLHNNIESIPCFTTVNLTVQYVRYEKENPTNISTYPSIKTVYLYEKRTDSNYVQVKTYDSANVASGDDWLNDFSQFEKGNTYLVVSNANDAAFDVEIADCNVEGQDNLIWSNLKTPPPEFHINPPISFNSAFPNELVLNENGDRNKIIDFYTRTDPLDSPNSNLGGFLNLSGCSLIKNVDCFGANISNFLIHNCPELINLQCQQNQISTLDLTDSTNIIDLNVSENKLTAIDLSQCTSIIRLNANTNKLNTIALNSNLTSLKSIDVGNNLLTSFGIFNAPNVNTILCSYNNFADFELQNNASLLTLHIHNNLNLSSLNVKGCLKLQNAYCDNCSLITANFQECFDLLYLKLNNNNLSQIAMDDIYSIMLNTNNPFITKYYNVDSNPGSLSNLQISNLESAFWFYDKNI